MSTTLIITRRMQIAAIINSFLSNENSEFKNTLITKLANKYAVDSSDDFIKNITKKELNELPNRLPKVIAAQVLRSEYIKKETNKVLKLERHMYSPEQNKLHYINGDVTPAPYCDTIEKALSKIYLEKRNLK